jgi:hypothetical protein
MGRFDSIRTQNWRVLLPRDWVEIHDQHDGSLHFESGDGEKALYIETWSDAVEYAPEEEIESFMAIEIGSIHRMEGRVWKTLTNWRGEEDGVAIGFQDSLDRENSYRIATKVLATRSKVVRACFHDYAAINYERSLEYFAEIIASLRTGA